MVHTGRPSRGCAVCRKRRIKCDEKAPECSYCIKTKQKCPGYKDKFDLAWRDQTAIAKNNVERRKRAREKSPSPPVDDMQPVSEISKDMLKYARPLRALSDRPQDIALDFFFQNYVLPGNGPYARKGWFEHIAPMFAKAEPDSVLRMSTTAIAGTLLVAWLDRRPDTPLSRAFYLKAVSLLKERVMTQNVADDEVLVSVLLLQMYEVMIGTAKRHPSPTAHLDGAVALIRHRGVGSFQSKISRDLLFAVRNQLIAEAFRTTKPLSPDMTQWSEQLPDADLSYLVRLDSIDVHLANLNAWIMRPVSHPWRYQHPIHPATPPTFVFNPQSPDPTSTMDPTTIYVLLNEVYKIDNKLLEWCDTIPTGECPVRVSGPECIHPSIPTYQDWVEIYLSVNVAYMWNSYRVSRIRAHVLIHTLLSALIATQPDELTSSPSTISTDNQDNDPFYINNEFTDNDYTITPDTPLNPSTTTLLHAQSTSQSLIQSLVDSICASIPYFLGSKLQPARLGDKTINFPHLPGMEVEDDHYQTAPAMAGWQLLGPLSYLQVIGDGLLRQGQKRWIGGQMFRLATLYNLGK